MNNMNWMFYLGFDGLVAKLNFYKSLQETEATCLSLFRFFAPLLLIHRVTELSRIPAYNPCLNIVKVLSCEVKRPGAFSMRTLDILNRVSVSFTLSTKRQDPRRLDCSDSIIHKIVLPFL